jgi:TetR/AcrR family transcriptional regulator, transcriptional repressor of bet genes
MGIFNEKHLHSPAAAARPGVSRMSAVSVRAAPSRRTASKESRRLQLIQATIQSIAKFGLSDTTIATVSREANLSQGIINLHFQTKERLLVETLEANAGPSPAARLQALLSVDYDKSVFDRDKIAVWFAFWSETKSRPTYRKLCAERDRGYDKVVTELVATIIAEGQYGPLDPEIIASGLAAMTEGLWLDLLVTPREMNREKARKIARTYLSCLFPRHFAA